MSYHPRLKPNISTSPAVDFKAKAKNLRIDVNCERRIMSGNNSMNLFAFEHSVSIVIAWMK